MKIKAQSLLEFAIILLVVTAIAVVSLQIINHHINSSSNNAEMSDAEQTISQEEANCIENGLSWDKQNGVCEAK